MTPELRELGNALSEFRENRAACDRLGLAIDMRRVGIAASIFHLRCVAVKSYRADLQPIALEGTQCQLDTLNNAIERLLADDRVTYHIRELVRTIAERAERALVSISTETQ